MRPFKKNLYWLVPLVIAINVPFVFLGGWLVMLLWNWLLPSIFSFHTVTFWQALGLLLLSRILFSGFHFQGSRRRGSLIDRLLRLSDSIDADSSRKLSKEERERLRERMQESLGDSSSTSEIKEL